MTGLELEFIVPAADLQPFVTLFYRFRCPGDLDDIERAAIAQLRFRLSPGAASYHFTDGSAQDAPSYHIVGPTTGPVRTLAKGPVWVFGMGLPPAGWAALLGSDAAAMVDRCTCAHALFGEEIAAAADALRGETEGAAMVAIVEPWLRRRFGGDHAATLDFVAAVDGWLAATPSPLLADLERATGLSRRQVERRCNTLYGCPPKLLARKYRALRAGVAMAAGDYAKIDGFYDQSHMIREVKRFTGLTPKRMREHPGPLAGLTIAQRRALEGRVGPLISET